MTGRRFAFYAHHVGRGPLDRVAAICEELGPEHCTVASAAADVAEVLDPRIAAVRLPTSVPDDGATGDVSANGLLHWAPTRPDVGLPWARAVLDWLDAERPDVVVVDVSVEVAVLARLAGHRIVVMRLHGDRDDPPHAMVHRLADAVLAPFPADLEHPATPLWVTERTTFCGAMTRGGGSLASVARFPSPDGRRRALIVWGAGGEPPSGPVIDGAAAGSPGWEWSMVGPPTPVRPPGMVEHHGWVDDVARHVAQADVVIGPPGDGLLAVVARTGGRLVVVPRPRPFDEQVRKAEMLQARRLAVVIDSWPSRQEWPQVLDRAMQLDRDAVRRLGEGGGPACAAEVICRIAGRAD